jgi:hypothetical protein
MQIDAAVQYSSEYKSCSEMPMGSGQYSVQPAVILRRKNPLYGHRSPLSYLQYQQMKESHYSERYLSNSSSTHSLLIQQDCKVFPVFYLWDLAQIRRGFGIHRSRDSACCARTSDYIIMYTCVYSFPKSAIRNKSASR